MLYGVARDWMKFGVREIYGVFDHESFLQNSNTWSGGSWKTEGHRNSLLFKFGRYGIKETRPAFIKPAAP